MSFGAHIVQLNSLMREISERLRVLESGQTKDQDTAGAAIEVFVKEQLSSHVDARLKHELDALMNAEFDGKLNAAVDSKLDAKLEQKLDVKVSVALKRERAFLEAAIKEAVAKTILDSVDARLRSLRQETDASVKAAVASMAAMFETIKVQAAEPVAADPVAAETVAVVEEPVVAELVPVTEVPVIAELVPVEAESPVSEVAPIVEDTPAVVVPDVVIGRKTRAKKTAAKK